MIAGYRDGDVVPVLVVGAGPVGVAAATMLAHRGVRTLVVDRYPQPYPLPRAVHVDDETARILQGIVGADAVTTLTTPARGLRLLDARHRTIGEFLRDRPVGVHGHPQANMFDQPDLERLLRDRLAGVRQVTLAGGVELVALDQEQDGAPAPVRATLRRIADGTRQHLYAHAVLGCDGASSTVRDEIGARMLDLHFEERWLVVDVRTERHLDAWDGVHQVCDPRRAATFMRVAAGRYRWEFRLHEAEVPADLLEPRRLSGLLRPWTKGIPDDELEVLRSAEYTFRARIADTWRDRRVFLLGDAAHLTPPFIGQGLCAGLRDAANLTWKLAGVLQGTLDEVVLGTYQSERAPHARAVVKKAVMVGRVMTGGQDGAALTRRVVLGGLCRVPGFTTRILDAQFPRLTPGPLVAPARCSLTGRLVPQPWVTIDGTRRRLDDVLGPGFAIVTLDVPGPALQRAARRLDARIVRITTAPGPAITPEHVVTAVDDDTVLASWLHTRRAVAVVVRPDRVVLAQTTSRDGGAGLAAHIDAWTWAVPPAVPSRLPATPGTRPDRRPGRRRASGRPPASPHRRHHRSRTEHPCEHHVVAHLRLAPRSAGHRGRPPGPARPTDQHLRRRPAGGAPVAEPARGERDPRRGPVGPGQRHHLPGTGRAGHAGGQPAAVRRGPPQRHGRPAVPQHRRAPRRPARRAGGRRRGPGEPEPAARRGRGAPAPRPGPRDRRRGSRAAPAGVAAGTAGRRRPRRHRLAGPATHQPGRTTTGPRAAARRGRRPPVRPRRPRPARPARRHHPPGRRRSGRVLPHRGDNGPAQARRAHSRQPDRRRLGRRSDVRARRGRHGPGRIAAVPRQRPRRHAARAPATGPTRRLGRPAGLPRHPAPRSLLAGRRAPPRRGDVGRPLGLRHARPDPGRRRHLHPAPVHRRRRPAAHGRRRRLARPHRA